MHTYPNIKEATRPRPVWTKCNELLTTAQVDETVYRSNNTDKNMVCYAVRLRVGNEYGSDSRWNWTVSNSRHYSEGHASTLQQAKTAAENAKPSILRWEFNPKNKQNKFSLPYGKRVEFVPEAPLDEAMRPSEWANMIDDIDNMWAIQKSDPISKTDPYMRGMANALEVVHSVIHGEDADFIDDSGEH